MNFPTLISVFSLVVCLLISVSPSEAGKVKKDVKALKKEFQKFKDEISARLEEYKKSCQKIAGLLAQGWVQNGDTYYLFEPIIPMTWKDAKAYCESKGGRLATDKSKEEHEFIKQQMKKYPGKTFWLDGHDMDVEGKWIWGSNPNDPITLTFWAPEEPNGNTQENCIHLINDGLWNDLSCDRKESVLCEQ